MVDLIFRLRGRYEINVRYLFCFLSSVSAIFSHPMVSTGANGPFFLIRLIAAVFSQFFGGSLCLTLFLLCRQRSFLFSSSLSLSPVRAHFFPFLAVSVFDGIVVVVVVIFLSFPLFFAPSSFCRTTTTTSPSKRRQQQI